ncbi:MAG: FAD-binding oxidoreductase [Nitrososphaerota archaeon]|nr:FAD-binding oxidoreductase [Nitrososphaerota archaeon]
MSTRSADLLIVGGGVVGLSVAYNCAKRGLGKITLLDRGRIGRGASSRNLGGVREQFSNEPMIRLMKYSIDVWEGLSKELRWNVLFDQKGYLMLARTESQAEQVKQNVRLQNSIGVNSVVLERDDVAEMLPQLKMDGVKCASFNKRDGAVHHDAVLWGLERAARRHGVEIIENVEATKLCTTSGRINAVETTAGTISTQKVINATGVFSRDLALTVGIDLPIRSFRREALVTEAYKHFLKPVFWDLTLGLLLSQTLRGEVLCDTRDPGNEESRDTGVSLSFLKKLAREVCELFPALGELHVLRQWSGTYDVTPDGSPILGESDEVSGLYFASGFTGHGLMVAPALGRLYADYLISGKKPKLLEPFRLSRFAEGKPIVEPLVAGRKIA